MRCASHHWCNELSESCEHAAIVMSLDDRSVDRRRLQERTTRRQRDHSRALGLALDTRDTSEPFNM
jgi:hypothetical protein